VSNTRPETRRTRRTIMAAGSIYYDPVSTVHILK
jgi:hypothetical protein